MPNIHHELLIGAAAEKVYHAVTTAEGLSGWWTPGVSANPELHSLARFPFGPDYFKEMEITELQPSKLVKWTCLKGDKEWVGTHLSFEMVEGSKESLMTTHSEMEGQIEQQKNFKKGTVLIFHHDDWKQYTPMFAECSYTWGQFMKSRLRASAPLRERLLQTTGSRMFLPPIKHLMPLSVACFEVPRVFVALQKF